MNYKASYYNLKCTNDNDELIVMNMRTQARIKVKPEDKLSIEEILQTNYLMDLEEDKYQELITGGFLLPESFDEIKWLELKNNEVIFGNDTLNVVIIPTNDCNFRCTYCFEQRTSTYMDSENETKIIKFLKRQIPKCKQFRFGWFGGEPLLCPDQVVHISEAANNLCKENKVAMHGEISTNGYCLTVPLFKELIKNRITEFQICLDGPERFHNETRPHQENNDSYQRILSNLIAIKEQVNSRSFVIYIRCNITPAVEPYMREHLMELAKYFKDDKRFCIKFQCVRNWGGDRIKEEQIVESEKEVYKRLYKLASDIGLYSADGMSFAPIVGYCSANRKNGFVFDYDSQIYKCAQATHSPEYRDICNIGRLSSSGKAIIDEGKQARWLVSSSPTKESCKKCVIYPYCMGGTCFFAKNIREQNNCNLYMISTIEEYLYSLDKKNQIKVYKEECKDE